MVTSLYAGLGLGAVYALIALGYNLTLIASGILNFAYANIVMVGAFIATWGLAAGGPSWVLVFLAAGLVCGGLALVEERVAVRPLKPNSHAELVTTVGFATIITGASQVIWGDDPIGVDLISNEPFTILGGAFSPIDLILLSTVTALAVALQLLGRRSRYGLAGLAHAEDREAAMLRGVNVRMLGLGAFALAGVVAGVLGVVVGAKLGAQAFLPLILAIKGFIGLTLGGIGTFSGALVGGLLVGILETTSAFYLGPIYSNLAVFVVFLIVLLARPQGIFGRRGARLV
jgi:branched-chain amino acid transport system permease protein